MVAARNMGMNHDKKASLGEGNMEMNGEVVWGNHLYSVDYILNKR